MATIYQNKGLELMLAAITDPVAGPSSVILMGDHVFGVQFEFLDQVEGDEFVSDGYARQVVVWDPPMLQIDGRVTQSAQDTGFGVVGSVTPAKSTGCYLYADTGVAATSPLLMCIQWAEEMTSDGTVLTIRWIPQFAAVSPSRF